MASTDTREQAFGALKQAMDAYYPITASTWRELQQFCTFRCLDKQQVLYRQGDVPDSFAFVYSGLFRVFTTDHNGKEYNKNFFAEGSFPGTMAALLTSTASGSSIEALEPSAIVELDFAAYRNLMLKARDLKLFQIFYLEKNWLLAKDAREVQLVLEDATTRYQRFLANYPSLSARIPQYHIASHLGITPTQLSRIRKTT